MTFSAPERPLELILPFYTDIGRLYALLCELPLCEYGTALMRTEFDELSRLFCLLALLPEVWG